MAYLGIGYNGSEETFLHDFAEKHTAWLAGDRVPRVFGNGFLVLYDSNTAREFAKKCKDAAPPNTISIFPMQRPIDM